MDAGRNWGDQTPPFYQYVLGDGHTADACSDPTATFDADGNAYVDGLVFDINSVANAIVVAKSNAGINGAFYHSPNVQSFQTFRTVPLGVVVTDNDPTVANDKEFIVVDASRTSSKKNNVYATWTRFTLTAPFTSASRRTAAPHGQCPLKSAEPVRRCARLGCAPGRQCLPPNGYRLDGFVEGSISVDNSGKLYFVWADFRNGAANCKPNGPAATATPPCDNDVFYAFSTDGGQTWSSAINLTPKSKFGPTAQWMPWSSVTGDGGTLWVAYYDRSYGNCEFSGCNDITLARVSNPFSASPGTSYQRITSPSMPNLLPSNNPLQAGFLGDNMWVAVDSGGHPRVVWADTRGLNGKVEEDVYFFLSNP